MKIFMKFKSEFEIFVVFAMLITSYVGLLFAALGFTLGLYFGLTEVVKLV